MALGSVMSFAHPDYTIVRELGRGGSATVYLAVQNSLNRRVALKVMHGLAADPSHGQRFLREGRIVAKLTHPHIVPVYAVGETPDGAEYFMAMEYLPGGNLAERAAELSVRDMLRTLDQVCQALAFAHEQGFVHRDVKPDNILFRADDHALLADFGIARATASHTHMTMTGIMLGTPDYMSPEQVAGDKVDPRSDLYSLGVVLYELLAGYKPLQGDSVMSTGLQHIVARPLPLPDNVAHFQPLLDRLLAKKPEDRLESAAALAAELESFAAAWQVAPEQRLSSLHSGEAPERASLTSSLTVQNASPRLGRRAIAGTAVALAVAAAAVWWLNPPAPDTIPAAPPGTAPPPAAAAPASVSETRLAEAQDAFLLDRWFGDEPDTALALFRDVLALDPDNALAAGRLEDMFTTTHQRAESAMAGGNLTRAQALIATLREAWPDDARIDALDTQLAETRDALERQRRDSEADARVRDLLAAADTALRAGDLLVPEGASAAHHYRQVLQMDAGNALAQAGLSNIADRLLNQAEDALREESFDAVDARLQQAAGVAPDHPRIAQIRSRAVASRDRLAAEEAARAARAELDQQVAALSTRVNAWVDAEEPSLERYTELSADLENLLARAPDHVALRSLQSVAERHAQRLAEAPGDGKDTVEDEDESEDRFRFGSF